MDLNLTDEQILLRDSARRFLADKHGAEARRARIAANTGLDRSLWAEMAGLGWLGLPIGEEAGGFGGSAADMAILAEELGRAAVLEPLVQVAVLAGGLIEALGTPGQQAEYLAPMIEGTSVPVLAHLEDGAQGRLDHAATRAEPVEGGWSLTGAKILVPAGMEADLFLVTAQTADGLGLFALAADAPGLVRTAAPLLDGGIAADLRLDAAGPAVRLGRDALAALEVVTDRAIAMFCADAVGVMDALLEATLAHTGQRIQFGKPLSGFQALQHRMAEMAVKCQEARASALLAALSVDARPLLRIRGVSGARARIGRVARQVAHETIQLHGALGFSDEMPIGIWFRRLYAFENTFGTTAGHLQRYAAAALTPEIVQSGLLRSGEAG